MRLIRASIEGMKRGINTISLLGLAASACFCAGLCGCLSASMGQNTQNKNAQYRAFGDSITGGATLADPDAEAYPALLSQELNVTVHNFADAGDQACDVAARQIFPNGESPALASHPVYSLLIGTNDVDNEGAGAYERTFIACHEASLAWLALPAEYKTLAGGSGFVADGPGALDTSNGWNAWTTQGEGSSVSFTITIARAGAIYAWPLMDDASMATYTYALDGVVSGTASVRPSPLMVTRNGTTRSLGFLRWADVPAGRHTITFTQISSGASGVSVVGVGSPAVDVSGQLPVVLAGTAPYQLHTGVDVGCQSSDAPCVAYNNDIMADVALLAGDGLDVRPFDTRRYLQGTSAEMSDATHPNARGQQELSEAVKAAWTVAN